MNDGTGDSNWYIGRGSDRTNYEIRSQIGILGQGTDIRGGSVDIRGDAPVGSFIPGGVSLTGTEVINFTAPTINFAATTITGLPGLTPVTKAQVDTAIGASTAGSDTLFYDQQGNFTAPSGGSSTTVLGTANQIDVATSGGTATVSLNANVTDAIGANTNKISYPVADSTKLAGIEALADVTDTENVVNSLTAGSNITIATDGTIALSSLISNRLNAVRQFALDDTTLVPLAKIPANGVTSIIAGTGVTVDQSTGAVTVSSDAQVNADWDATSGTAEILNKPTTITTDQASEIVVNNSKVSFPGFGTTSTTALTGDTETANRLSITGNNLNLLEDTTVLSSATLPEGITDYNDLDNIPIATVQEVSTFVLGGTRTNVSVQSPGVNEFSTITIRDSFDSTEATFSYDPDVENTVYSNSIVDSAFTNPGGGIATNITQIANDIAALETNITWDGVITRIVDNPTNVLPTGQGVTYNNFGLEGHWFMFDESFLVLTVPDGTAWDSVTISSITFYGDYSSYVAPPSGTTMRATLPNGAWFEWLLGGTTFTSTFARFIVSSVVRTSGTISGISSIGQSTQVDVDEIHDASRIVIDLGTTTNIESSFAITGGTNAVETLINSNGVIGSASLSTTITVFYNGSIIDAFTAAVQNTGTSNVDIVGQRIADAVSNSTQTPVNYTGFYNTATNTISFTSDTPGGSVEWDITINNNGITGVNEGNVVIASSTQGLTIVNQIDILSFPDGTSMTTAPQAGDAGLTNANVFTNTNTFSNASNNGSIQVANRIVHQGDLNTYIDFSPDTILMQAGGINFFALQSSGFSGDRIVCNVGNDDVDYQFNKNTSGTWLNYDSGTTTLTIDPDTTLAGALPPAIPTADGEYKLVIASGVATWEII